MTERHRAPSRSGNHSASDRAPEHEQDDSVLLLRVAAGDQAALGLLYDRWSERVHTLAFWILRDEDDADDVVEETFWQLWRTAAAYDGARAAASTWLMVIARSRALDQLRRRKRRADWMAAPSTANALRHEAEIDPATPVEEQLDGGARRTNLLSVLGALPAEQRSTLQMAYFEGLSHSEIARRTQLPLGTVKTRIRLAMQKLREAYRLTRESGP